MEQRLDELNARLLRAMRARLHLAQEALERGEAAITHLSPLLPVSLLRQRVETISQRLLGAEENHLRRGREDLERLMGTLQALSPLAVLARGYSICRQQTTGQVVREAHAVAPGMHVDITLWQGSRQCTVESVMVKGSGDARTDV
jgi:exodeoxyribonuclease VII large subunit